MVTLDIKAKADSPELRVATSGYGEGEEQVEITLFLHERHYGFSRSIDLGIKLSVDEATKLAENLQKAVAAIESRQAREKLYQDTARAIGDA